MAEVLALKIVSVAQMRALEAAAFSAGITESALQQRAGNAVAKEISRLVQPGERIAVLVGHGNNGRDGAVAAEWLAEHHAPVDLVLAPRHAVTPEELTRLQARGASIVSNQDDRGVSRALENARLALDALTGIGATGPLREPLASLARTLNGASAKRGDLHVMALDLPSGIDADSGEVLGEAVWADSTVSLGAVKQGLLRFPAAERVGKLVARDIGLGEFAASHDLPYALLDEPALGGLVPSRPLDAHKYRFGRTLVIAGADHFPGAAILCSGAAARIGSGLVTLASTPQAQTAVAAHWPEVTYTRWSFMSVDNPKEARSLMPYLRSHNSVVVGPGLGRGQAITKFVGDLLKLRPHEHRLVVDADGLVALSEMQEWWTRLGTNVVLTPHSGELERLVGHDLDPDEPAWAMAGRLARAWGCVLVAKGPFTCVAAPDGRVDVWPRANPALATGGTGDVLAGVCGGLLAQGMHVWDAARLAVGVHGLAAERVVTGRKWRTLLASDLLEELPAALDALAGPTRRR